MPGATTKKGNGNGNFIPFNKMNLEMMNKTDKEIKIGENIGSNLVLCALYLLEQPDFVEIMEKITVDSDVTAFLKSNIKVLVSNECYLRSKQGSISSLPLILKERTRGGSCTKYTAILSLICDKIFGNSDLLSPKYKDTSGLFFHLSFFLLCHHQQNIPFYYELLLVVLANLCY